MSSKIVYSGTENFEKQVLKSNVPVVVYFFSENCPICEAFDPMFDRIAERYEGQIAFVKVFRQQNRPLAEEYGIKSSPTVVFFKEGSEVCSRLTGYITKPEFSRAIEIISEGRCSKKERHKVYCDVLILGAGPAGLTSAIYTARSKLLTVLVDEGIAGGQVSTTYHVANYPGTNGVVRGVDLMENMKKQAEQFGAQIDDMKEVAEVRLDSEEKYIKTEDADYHAKAIIIATGSTPRKLPAEGEREFRGRGVHYCATCDGALYQDANVLVVGGGNSAVEEAVFLTRYAKHVTIVHRNEYFTASKAAQEEALRNPAIDVIYNSEVRKINGESFMKSVTVENTRTNETKEIDADGIFVYIGMEPRTRLFKNSLKLSDYGYIITDEDMKASIPGVFAAGDVREKKVRQIANAVGDGAIAGIMAEKYVNGR